MSRVERVASLFVVGFHRTTLGDELKLSLDEGVGGVVLFGRNVQSRDQVGELVSAVRKFAGRPLLVAVDQEGGTVQRLRDGFTRIPDARSLAESSTVAEVELLGHAVGTELRSVGVNWNFAPVLDVDTHPDNPVIGRRAFGSDPEVVSSYGLAFARGLERAGVASCGKHYPGHGDTDSDSHFELPRLTHRLERLQSLELVPFCAYSAAGHAALMTAHVLFDNLGSSVPATMSEFLLTQILRQELGFAGLIVSDDLEMKAVAAHYGPGVAAVRALGAGVDTLLACSNRSVYQSARDAIVDALEAAQLSPVRLDDAVARSAAFRARWAE